MLKKIYSHIVRPFIIRKIFKNELNNIKNIPENKIILNSVRFVPNVFLMELNLALIFLKSGYSVEIILDDGEFEHNDTVLYRSNKSLSYYNFIFSLNKVKRKIEFFLWKKVVGGITNNLNFIKVSEITKNITTCFNLIDEKNYVKESMIRFFQTDRIDNDNIHIWYEKLTFKNVYISKKIGIYADNQLNKNNQTLFLTSHGIYSVWGPAFNEIKIEKRKIVYGPNFYQINSLSFFNHIHQVTNKEDSLSQFLKKDLSNSKIEKVSNYISNRFSFNEKDTKVYFANDSEKKQFVLKDRKDLPGKVFVAYPNIVWDGNVYERNNLFITISDWIITLIEHFKKDNTNSLIIRFHPAETTWFKGTKTFESIIKQHLKGIESFDNIIIISSAVSFNSYNLLKNYSDYTLVYDGIIGLESTFFNVPVIFAANGRFNVSDYGIQFYSAEDYMEYISNPKSYNKIESDKIIAQKLIYYYMFVNSRFFPVLDNENSDFGLDIDVFYKNKEKFNLSIDSIMKGINECL
ncbi:MAG: hypothetical protein P8I26_05085 [Flavobacteriaceae bacterium]|nr:hypothetical protein [Flavobacteriaceae bacterium]